MVFQEVDLGFPYYLCFSTELMPNLPTNEQFSKWNRYIHESIMGLQSLNGVYLQIRVVGIFFSIHKIYTYIQKKW